MTKKSVIHYTLATLLALLSLAAPAAAQNPFSLINFGTTPVDTNSGNKSAGTLRVVLATDGTAPTTVFKIDLSGTSANGTAILVTGTGGTFPVTGTFWQATQPVSGTFWQATQPVSAASLPLPALAATSTKQSDGTQKTQIVDGSGNVIASTSNNLNVQCANCSGSGASAVDNATMTESTSVFAPVGGEFLTTPGTVTTGHQAMAAITAHRALQVSLFDTSGSAITPATDATTNTTSQTTGPQIFYNGSAATPTAVGADGRSIASWADTVGRLHVTGDASMGKLLVTPDSVALPANQSVNVSQINAATPLMGNGITGTGSPRVTLASDTTSNTNPLYASAVGTSTTAAASGCYLASAASTNATNCKASAGNFYGFRFVNTTATLYYLRLYNLATAPTCSSATGYIESIPIPASTTGGGIVAISDIPINYSTGIAFCFTGGSSSTDNTNAATGVFGALLYK